MTDAKVWMNGKELLAIVDGFEAYYEEKRAEILELAAATTNLAEKAKELYSELQQKKYPEYWFCHLSSISYWSDDFSTVSKIKHGCKAFRQTVILSDDGRILVDLRASAMVDAMKDGHKHIDSAISRAKLSNEWLETKIGELQKELEALSNVQNVEKTEENGQAPEEKEYLSFRDQMLLMVAGGVIVFIGLLIFVG